MQIDEILNLLLFLVNAKVTHMCIVSTFASCDHNTSKFKCESKV